MEQPSRQPEAEPDLEPEVNLPGLGGLREVVANYMCASCRAALLSAGTGSQG